MSMERQVGIQNPTNNPPTSVSNGGNNNDESEHKRQSANLLTLIIINKLADSGCTLSPKAIEALASCLKEHQKLFLESMINEIIKVGISNGSKEEIRGVDIIKAFEQTLKTDNKKNLILHITGNTGASFVGAGVTVLGTLLTASLSPLLIGAGISCIILGILIFIFGIYKGK